MAGPSPEQRPRSGVVRRWWLSGWVAAVAVVPLLTTSPSPSNLVVAVLLLVAAWALSPRFFPASSNDREARETARRTGAPVVYWRPGCSYCLRLRIALGRAGNRAVWVDVTRDPAASGRVRAANNGDETVPTVFVGDAATTNPRPAWVRDRLPQP